MNDQFKDDTYKAEDDHRVIYLAGGCFWGLQKLMNAIDGVVQTQNGYANGDIENPTYEQVCTGDTGARETVRVIYDPDRVSLDAILYAFLSAIDPTQPNRQGADIGSQYQTGIFYIDDASRISAERIAATEKSRYGILSVEVKPLKNFFEAEEEHQNYLEKHPEGYCHIPDSTVERIKHLVVDPAAYTRPDDEHALWSMLSPSGYDVTQRQGTENPGSSDFWQSEDAGIYVDIVTGEPLFSSSDKFISGCGWPSFCKPIDDNAIRKRTDTSHGMVRTEVSSRVGNSHLGHLFEDDPDSPNGIRYCINGVALRFIPFNKMDEEGYGAFKGSIEHKVEKQEELEEEPKKKRGLFRRR